MASQWWLYAHLVGVLALLLFHGAPIGVAFRLRKEVDPRRVRALVELSWYFVGAIHMAMFAILITGIVLAYQGGYRSAKWLWVATGLFILMWVAMFVLGTKHYDKVRRAVGAKEFYPKKGKPVPPPASLEELHELLSSNRPLWLSGLGIATLLVFLWLMMMKPF